MKKTGLILLGIYFCFINGILADGPGIKDGNLISEHQNIKLTEEQVSHAGIYRYVLLNDEQVKKLKPKSIKKFPRMLEVITAPFNDCTCGMNFYGLWSDRNEVQIYDHYLNRTLDNFTMYGKTQTAEELKNEDFTNYYYKDFDVLKKTMRANVLTIDYDGNIYQQGELVNNLETAFRRLEKKKTEENEGKSIFVETPPLKNLKTVIKTYKNIDNYFSKKGYEVYSFFKDDYIEVYENGYDDLPLIVAKKSKTKPEKVVDDSSAASWKIKASSNGEWKGTVYSVENLKDSSVETAWVEGVPGLGLEETLTFYDFTGKKGEDAKINILYMRNGYTKTKKTFDTNARVRSLVLYKNDTPLYLLRTIDISTPQKLSFPEISLEPGDKMILKITDVYGGERYQDTAVTTLLPGYEKEKKE